VIHTFTAHLDWKKKSDFELKLNRKAIKNHVIEIEHKTPLSISAAKSFKGDQTLYNPEDLLLSSLASCHMMSYLYCCDRHQIEVLQYHDHAEVILEVFPDGSGKIIKAILNPTVTIKDEKNWAKAIALHYEARQLCFIANSCNFEIEHHPIIVI